MEMLSVIVTLESAIDREHFSTRPKYPHTPDVSAHSGLELYR